VVTSDSVSKIVLVLTDRWLARAAGKECTVETSEEFRECLDRVRGSEHYSLLLRVLAQGSENRVIYLGDDGVLPYLLGERVLDLYGSRTRLRCRSCGYRWWIIDGYTRCPNCGSTSYEPDYTGKGQRPRQRLLLEALYEVTSADVVYFSEMHDPPETIEVLMLLVATKFTRVIAERVPRIAPGSALSGVEIGGLEKLIQ